MNNKIVEELNKPIVKYGLIVTAILVLIQQVFIPWFEWRTDKVEALRVKASFVISEAKLQTALAEIERDALSLNSDFEVLEQGFKATSSGSARVYLPTQVRQLCEGAQVNVKRVSVSEVEIASTDMLAFNVSLEAQASIDKLFKLVAQFENSESFYVVDRLTIYSRKREQMKVRMELLKYVKKPQ